MGLVPFSVESPDARRRREAEVEAAKEWREQVSWTKYFVFESVKHGLRLVELVELDVYSGRATVDDVIETNYFYKTGYLNLKPVSAMEALAWASK